MNTIKKNDIWGKHFLKCYIIWEVINLIAIQYAKYYCAYHAQSRIMFLSVCVNTLVMACYYLKHGREKSSRDNLLAAGLFFTFLADLFLTLLHMTVAGYSLFCLVEIIYAAYFNIPGREKINVISRSLLFLPGLILIWERGLLEPANILGVLNLSLLFANVICAWIIFRHRRGSRTLMPAMGITFFAGCDFSLLAMALSTGKVYDIADYLVWFFYVPAQVLLVLTYMGSEVESYYNNKLECP